MFVRVAVLIDFDLSWNLESATLPYKLFERKSPIGVFWSNFSAKTNKNALFCKSFIIKYSRDCFLDQILYENLLNSPFCWNFHKKTFIRGLFVQNSSRKPSWENFLKKIRKRDLFVQNKPGKTYLKVLFARNTQKQSWLEMRFGWQSYLLFLRWKDILSGNKNATKIKSSKR